MREKMIWKKHFFFKKKWMRFSKYTKKLKCSGEPFWTTTFCEEEANVLISSDEEFTAVKQTSEQNASVH